MPCMMRFTISTAVRLRKQSELLRRSCPACAAVINHGNVDGAAYHIVTARRLRCGFIDDAADPFHELALQEIDMRFVLISLDWAMSRAACMNHGFLPRNLLATCSSIQHPLGLD